MLPSLINGPQDNPLFFIFLFSCRMARGHEETSNNKVGRKRGTPWETPIVSSLVTAMSVEELRSSSQVLGNIRLEVIDGPIASTIRGANNAVYFTREKFAARLHFPV